MRYGTIDRDYVTRLASWPEAADGPLLMVNLMRYRAEADYGSAGERGVSGRQADDRYAPLDVFERIGAALVFLGDVVESSTGCRSGEEWDRVAIVRYASRRSFIEMQSRADFQAKHVHKEAGMEFTIVLGCTPTGPFDVGALPDELAIVVVPAGHVSDDRSPELARLAVEGTVIGDDRRWDVVSFRTADEREPAVPDGSLRVGVRIRANTLLAAGM